MLPKDLVLPKGVTPVLHGETIRCVVSIPAKKGGDEVAARQPTGTATAG
jgi:hypothetical protein